MTDPNLPSAPLCAWAENTLGPLAAVHNVSSEPSTAAAVWHLIRRSDNARFHLKSAASPRDFTRETFAYRHAVPALGPGRAPRLVATSARHLALILTTLPGTPLPQLRLTEAEFKTVHWRAGALVSQLHQAGRPNATAHREASSLLSRLADASARHVDAAGDLLSAEDQKFVMTLADRLHLLDRLPLGFVHGGVLESSLLWSDTAWPARSARPALQDFERSRFAPAVLDFVHLAYGLWATRPRARTAFFHGYGRPLGHDERQALRCLTGLRAVRSLAEGRARGDRAAVGTARSVLDRLKNEVGA
jgi:hypothetical protein